MKENKDSSAVFIAPAPENETQIKKFLKKYAFDYNITPFSTDGWHLLLVLLCGCIGWPLPDTNILELNKW